MPANTADDIYLSRFGAWDYPLAGMQRMTSRRMGPHANLVAKIRDGESETIVKVPANVGSRYATRAIQKEFGVLNHLSTFSRAIHIPKPLILRSKPGDCAAEYSVCQGVPMNLFMARHISEPVWQHIMDWTCRFLIDLGKSRSNEPPISLADPHGAMIERPLSIIATAFPNDAPMIREYVKNILTDDLPYHFVPVHGDFNPWNMLIVPATTLGELHPYVLDWEDYSDFGLPLFDGFYFMMVCIWILAFGETKSNNLAQIDIDDLIQRNHLITKLAKQFCLSYGQEMKLNKHMIDPLFILFLLRATAEDIRAKRDNPRSAVRWLDILKFQLKENVFLNAVKLMFLYALRSKGQLTQNPKLMADSDAEIKRILAEH